jgi:putative component of membrane protein insertase Oxa1/YidC/SpoIIIJ protein YidD
MRPGRVARALISDVERYRRWGNGRGSGCRFEPSCSTFAIEVLRTRSLPIACSMTVWRVVRCTPVMHTGAHDPVRRAARLRPRSGTIPTAFTLMALTGFLVLTISAVASAQEVTGGCSGRVNGRHPSTMKRVNPLVVAQGQIVRIHGFAPPDVAALPESQVQSLTVITVAGIEGLFGVDAESHRGRGHAWGGQVNIDRYLDFGVGLYRVTAEAIGDPGWKCTASGYVRLDGNPLSKPVGQAAAGAAAGGGIGAVASTITKRRPDEEHAPSGPTDAVEGEDSDPSVWDRDLKGQALVTVGCAFFLFGPSAVERIAGGLSAVALRPLPGRVWIRAHPVLGAISGLFFGLGIAVLGQQFALWPLTVLTGIVLPLYAALACGVRAWIGQPYVRRVGSQAAVTCPTCGNASLASDTFCRWCGAPLRS